MDPPNTKHKSPDVYKLIQELRHKVCNSVIVISKNEILVSAMPLFALLDFIKVIVNFVCLCACMKYPSDCAVSKLAFF